MKEKGAGRTLEVDTSLRSIEAAAALLLMIAHDDDSSSIRGLNDLLLIHGQRLHEAHDTLAACFEGEGF